MKLSQIDEAKKLKLEWEFQNASLKLEFITKIGIFGFGIEQIVNFRLFQDVRSQVTLREGTIISFYPITWKREGRRERGELGSHA